MSFERKRHLKPLDGEIGDKINIPQEDLINWTQALKDGGFTNEEIDMILNQPFTDYHDMRFRERLDARFLPLTEEQRKILNTIDEELKKRTKTS